MTRDGLAATWSIRKLVTVALLCSVLGAMPVFAIAFVRLAQIRGSADGWARMAEASRWLGTSAVCDGAADDAAAAADLARWDQAVQALTADAHWLSTELAAALGDVAGALFVVRQGPSASYVAFATSRCVDMRRLAERALAAAIALGLDPASRPDRAHDLMARDLVTYFCIWVLFEVALAGWLRRHIVASVRRVERVLDRIAAGDISAVLPSTQGGPLHGVIKAVQQAVGALERREEVKSTKILELRNVVRQLVAVFPDPLFIVTLEGEPTIEYANSASEFCGIREFSLLSECAGGALVARRIDELRAARERDGEWEQGTLSLVRDNTGRETRAIVLVSA
jgi:hypothetical protein